MLIALIGAGRIGGAVAEAAREAGHTVRTLRSDSPPAPLRSMDLDLLFLAAAPEDEDKYDGFSDFRQSLEWINSVVAPDVPLASVSFLTPDQLQAVADSRPAVRFMCSSAVQDPNGLRFYDASGEEAAIDRLEAALPGPWRGVASDKYEQYTRLLIVSAVHCALLDRIECTVDLDADEVSFLRETLAEAGRMIRLHDDSVADALDSALTPGGITQRLVEDGAVDRIVDRLFNV